MGFSQRDQQPEYTLNPLPTCPTIQDQLSTLSKKRRQSEFKALKDDEVKRLEAIIGEAFDGFDEVPRE